MDPKTISWKLVLVLVFLALAAVGVTGLVGLALQTVPEGRFGGPEIALTIVLLSGVVALVAVLITAVTAFAALGLSDPQRAFGMPEGTIRAVIALSLILIFSMTSLFLYGQLRSSPTARIVGLTQEQVAAIPGEEIVSSSPNATNASLFDVSRRLVSNPTSEDFAKQLLTTISTLVVAVAGFYFGTNAVSTARGGGAGLPPVVIRGIKPNFASQGEEKRNVEISGKNFASPKSVILKRGSVEIAFQSILSSPTLIQGNLSIPAGQEKGLYELIVVNGDGGEDRLPDAFTVK